MFKKFVNEHRCYSLSIFAGDERILRDLFIQNVFCFSVSKQNFSNALKKLNNPSGEMKMKNI